MNVNEGNEPRLLESINLMGNKKLILWLNIASIPLMIVLFLLFLIMPVMDGRAINQEFDFMSLLLFFVAVFGLLIIHELIHGMCFKVFNPQGTVKFGFKNGMAYATSPNSYYTKRQFSIICLAPFILLSLGLYGLYATHLISPTSFIFLGAIHGSGCIGDFYWAYLLVKAPKDVLVEDTEVGINFYTTIRI